MGGDAAVSSAMEKGSKNSRPSTRLGATVGTANGSGLGRTGWPTSRVGTLLSVTWAQPRTANVKTVEQTRNGLDGMVVPVRRGRVNAPFEDIKPALGKKLARYLDGNGSACISWGICYTKA